MKVTLFVFSVVLVAVSGNPIYDEVQGVVDPGYDKRDGILDIFPYDGVFDTLMGQPEGLLEDGTKLYEVGILENESAPLYEVGILDDGSVPLVESEALVDGVPLFEGGIVDDGSVPLVGGETVVAGAPLVQSQVMVDGVPLFEVGMIDDGSRA